MLKDHHYDLYSQMVQELRSYWRIHKYYLKDARGCKKCSDFWKKLSKDKEGHIKELQRLIEAHK